MAVSRRLALISLGTILLCFLITRAAVADSDHGDNVHVARHFSASIVDRAEAHQCRQENDDVDDDFDDTYKIVNNIAITLSASGRILKEEEKAAESEDEPASEEEKGTRFTVGH